MASKPKNAKISIGFHIDLSDEADRKMYATYTSMRPQKVAEKLRPHLKKVLSSMSKEILGFADDYDKSVTTSNPINDLVTNGGSPSDGREDKQEAATA